MARIQILELPEVERADGTYETPFALVVDDLPLDRVARKGELDPRNEQWQSLAERVGARAVLVFTETVDIPANEVGLDADGHPVRLRVEGDFTGFREQVQQEIHAAQQQLAQALGTRKLSPKPVPRDPQ